MKPIGIDLGTTYTAVSTIDAAGRTQMIRNDLGEILTPSAVLFDDAKTVVGKEAKKAGPIQPERVAQDVKRDMGSGRYCRKLGDTFLPPEVIQAGILAHLEREIRSSMGNDVGVVITVPAFFDEPRRRATAIAGKIAGLNVLDIVNEPTAAALAFGEHSGVIAAPDTQRQRLRTLIYDLGGGTFDVTLLDISGRGFFTIATDGDRRLGGRDWDQALIELVAKEFEKTHREPLREDAESQRRILLEIEHAKHALSVRQQAAVHIDQGGNPKKVVVSRDQFEQASAHLLERTISTTAQLVRSQSVSWGEIDHVLLVGGATRMPMVAEALEKLSGKAAEKVLNPDEAVARGAAIYAKYLLDEASADQQPSFEITNVNAHTLGIRGVEVDTDENINATLIPKNTRLPAKARRTFVTRRDDQKSIVIQALEGESARPDECTDLGRATLRGLPAGLPAGSEIEVTCQYETNGCLSLLATVPTADQDLKLDISRQIDPADGWIDRWQRVVCDHDDFRSFQHLANQLEAERTETDQTSTTATSGVSDETVIPYEPTDEVPQAVALESARATTTSTASTELKARRTRLRRAQPSVAMEMLKVVSGGIFGLVVGQIIVWQLMNRDPLNLAPHLPERLSFLAPDMPPVPEQTGEQVQASQQSASQFDEQPE